MIVDVPSCLWLDTALQEIIHDHPTYGSVPLVNRRRKGPIDSSISSSSVSSGDPSILNWPLLSQLPLYRRIIITYNFRA